MSMKEKKMRGFIIAISILIPAVVTILFFAPRLNIGHQLDFLPLLNACVNGTASLVLILGVMAIKKGNKEAHRRWMTTAILLSVVFLVSYVLYHLTHDSTKFGDLNHDGVVSDEEQLTAGAWRYVYYFVLLSHILLSVIIVPLVLITYVRALAEKFDKHRKIARITFPLWLYVTITGVLVYLLIAPYYPT